MKTNTDNCSLAQGNQLDLLLCQVPESIDWPARVRLAGSLNVTAGNAVTITTNNVTLDLNGFAISSTAPSAAGTGILLNSGLKNITIANGSIQGGVTFNGGTYGGSGFGYGIFYSGSAPMNVLVSHVSVSGCLFHGILLGIGDSTVVESCTVRTVGAVGMSATTVNQLSAIECGSTAIFGVQVSDCRGQSIGNSAAIFATTAQNCYGSSSGGDGVLAVTALNCYGVSATNAGLRADNAQNCRGESGSGSGVLVNYTAQNCYGSSGASGFGVTAGNVQNCYGFSSGGIGVSAPRTAQNCFGISSSGTGLSASIAIGCSASGSPAFSPATHQYFCGSGANPYP